MWSVENITISYIENDVVEEKLLKILITNSENNVHSQQVSEKS